MTSGVDPLDPTPVVILSAPCRGSARAPTGDRLLPGGILRVLRFTLTLVAAAAVVCLERGSSAEEVAVPVAVEADLTVKVAAYDKNFRDRAGKIAHVLIVYRAGDVGSEKIAGQMQKALGGFDSIAGLPHDEEMMAYVDSGKLAQAAKTKHASILYLAPGFSDGDLDSIAKSMTGADVLTVASMARYVPRGVVFGFDLVSGKPKLLVHLTQARRQNVVFRSEVLKLMKVYE